jgi:pimeloyl-ACP methyl ester carboxylesterase
MFVKIENRKIHYKKMGAGKPILFVHGWGGTLYSLHAVALLASKQYCAILIDLPGFGKSDNPPPHWGVEGYAEIINKFCQELKLMKPHYVGHSFGGELGIYLAAHYPALIDKLIISNSSFKRERKISRLARLLKTFPRNKFIILKTLEPHIKKLYYKLFHKESDLIKYPHLETNFRKIITQDLTQETTRITADTLLLWGEDDTMTPVIWGYELKKTIPGSILKVFPKVRHNLPILYPQEVWNEIKTFLTN